MAPKKAAPSKKLKQTTLFGLYDSSPTRSSPTKQHSFASKPVSPSKRKRKPASHPPPIDPGNLSDEQGDSDSSAVGAIKFENQIVDLSNGLNEGTSSPRSPLNKRKTRILDSDEEVIHTDGRGGDAYSEKNNQIIKNSKGKRTTRKVVLDSDPDSDAEEDEPQPRMHKRLKSKKPASQNSDDLSDEVDQDQIIESRLRTRGKRSVFQKNLDKLKRKKRGGPSGSSPSTEDENLSEDEDENNDEEPQFTPFAGARPDQGDESDPLNEDYEVQDDSDFIVEDDNVSPVTELPMRFSMNTHQDLVHHFKVIFQFFVHIAVQPSSKRWEFMKTRMQDEEYFSVPLQIARRKLSGLRDSLVASSVWRRDFKRLLEKYPEFEVSMLQFAVPVCDACHLGNRLSTRIGRLVGRPYHRLGFEPLEGLESDDPESDTPDDEQKPREFNLGRFCAKRTSVFHAFTHWEYSLFQAINREIKEIRSNDGDSGFVRIAYHGGLRPPDDLTDADAIVEWLDQRKIIEMEYQKVKDMMESARNLEMAAKKAENED